jgi:3-mercaptopyruvate sulfurtransferase SseA
LLTGTLALTGLVALGGCGDENTAGTSGTETEFLVGTSEPVNFNDSSTVEQPAGVNSYAASASEIPDTDLAAKASGTTEQTPGEIAQESDADYSNNTSGLITAGTLQNWMTDWPNNKPSGVEDLVILEVNAGGLYFQSDEANGVRTYVVERPDLHETRNNGVVDTPTMVASEDLINQTMAKYDIDPANDMVVVAMGQGSGFSNMVMGRAWYALRYWGAPADHLAILNGGAQYHYDSGTLTSAGTDDSVLSGHYDGTSDSDTPPAPPNLASAPTPAADLPEANMQLLISYEEMLKEAKEQRSGTFIWDVRRAGEYFGMENQGRGYAFEGHIRGAEWLPYDELLVADEGYRYLDKEALAGELDGLGYQDGQTVITHCVTTYRAMVSGIATGVVLGYPTRFYDGAWMQWGTMAHHMNKQGTYNLASDSPWRADIAEASRWINYDPDAADSDSSTSSSSDDGVSVPSQGCGG